MKNPQPVRLFSSKGYEYTWTEPRFNHILWGCAGKWFQIRLKVYVNADVGKGSAAVCWNNPRFFQPCSQFVNPAAFMAKPRWDWSQILLWVQVSLWRSLRDFPIATGAVWDCRKWLRIVTATMPMEARQTAVVYSTTQNIPWVNDRHWKRSLIQWFGLWHRTECALFEENEKLNLWAV